MNSLRYFIVAAATALSLVVPGGRTDAAEGEAADISPADLANRLAAKQQDGTSLIRMRMTGGAGAMQVQVKSRATRGSAELVYQLLWPKERKGEAVLLRRSGRGASAVQFMPPDKVTEVSSLSQPLFGSDLSYEDVIDIPFSWDNQAIVGNETVQRVNCTILESKPGKSRSSYASVRTWVDTRRMVPLRIEKYGPGGKLVRRIETTRVVTDDKGRPIPANLSVSGPRGTVTEIDGSKIKHDVKFSDREFTQEGLGELGAAQSSGD